jgi:mono/diheme cytochrome c family protein
VALLGTPRARRLAAAGLALALLAAAAGVAAWRRAGRSDVQRGSDLAALQGCFSCHGPGGLRGFVDESGGGVGDVPPFGHDELAAYAQNEAEIREWILDGMPRRLREEAGAEGGPGRLIIMPAFRGRLSEREVDQLVAYVKAAADYGRPEAGPLAEGLTVGARWGCFTCHGPQGRGTPPNPGSFKGYIPAWDGPDLAELARDEGELREWILDGSPRRLRDHLVAAWFLERQTLRMPAYRGRISEQEVETLVRYIHALRGPAAR